MNGTGTKSPQSIFNFYELGSIFSTKFSHIIFMILLLNVKISMGVVEIAVAVLALYNFFRGLAHLNADVTRRKRFGE